MQAEVRTRPGATIRVPAYAGRQADELITIYGATFEHVGGPTRPIEGIVRDIETKQPLGGIMIHGERSIGNPIEYVQAITDAQGHYRLVGLPRGREGHVVAVARSIFRSMVQEGRIKVPRDEDLPYLRARLKVGKTMRTGRSSWISASSAGLGDRPGHRGGHREVVRAQVEYFVSRTILTWKTTPHFGGP